MAVVLPPPELAQIQGWQYNCHPNDELELLPLPALPLRHRVDQAAEVLAVAVLVAGCQSRQLLGGDEALQIGDLFQAGDLQAFPLFDGSHELTGLQQRDFRARIEPGKAAAEDLDVQLSAPPGRGG